MLAAARAALDGVATHVTLTQEAPAEWDGFARRIDADMLAAVGPPAGLGARFYVCGPTPFVEEAAGLLVALGHAPAAVRTVRCRLAGVGRRRGYRHRGAPQFAQHVQVPRAVPARRFHVRVLAELVPADQPERVR